METKTFVIHWHIWSNLQGLSVRRGFIVTSAPNKREARKRLRDRLSGQVFRGEKIVVDNIVASSF